MRVVFMGTGEIGAPAFRWLLDSPEYGIQRSDTAVPTITGPRIGITKAAELPWRFGDPKSLSLSRKF